MSVLYLYRFQPEPGRTAEFLATLWQGPIPEDLRLHRWLYVDGEPRQMVLLWEGEEPARQWVERAFGSFGTLTAETVTDATPGLAACLKALREGDTLAVWKLDRLGRDLRHLVNTVHDLTARGVGFKVLSGHGASIDTTSPSGKLVFGIFAAMAEFERELIVERTKAGMAAARARGRNGGRKEAQRSRE